jgi:hypothetical protein
MYIHSNRSSGWRKSLNWNLFFFSLLLLCCAEKSINLCPTIDLSRCQSRVQISRYVSHRLFVRAFAVWASCNYILYDIVVMAPAEKHFASLSFLRSKRLLTSYSLCRYLQGIRHRERRQTNFFVMTGPDKCPLSDHDRVEWVLFL